MKTATQLYGGIDLHSNNSVVAIIDKSAKLVYQKKLPNDMQIILKELLPYREKLQGLVVESTYNWYWLVDGLKKANYRIHLAHMTGNQPYTGLKYTDDKSDAIWIARLLQLNILSEGYIYPQEKRGLRELLRRRMILVRQQTMNLLGIQSMITRFENIKFSSKKIKESISDKKKILDCITDSEIRLAVEAQMCVLSTLMEQIGSLEEAILRRIKEEKAFNLLKMIPGVGSILAMTILLETGQVKRFKGASQYSSYCRCVESKRVSNEKKKGKNNVRNGNRYLGWAFIEATHHAIRHYEPIKKFYQKKVSKKKRVVAIKSIANKLSKATYFILRDGVKFDMWKVF